MGHEQFPATSSDLFGGNGARKEKERRHPYREGLRQYLTTLHSRITLPFTSHPELHRKIESQEAKAAEFMQASDISAQFVASPEFQKIVDTQKEEFRGICSVAVIICIDGRLVPILLGGNVYSIAEAKAGVLPTEKSPIDGRVVEIASHRIRQEIIDRPIKPNYQTLQINTGHQDSGEINCAAYDQFLEEGILPRDNTREAFKKMLHIVGEAEAKTYNTSALLNGRQELPQVAMQAMIDTRTSGLIFEGPHGILFTTKVTNDILNSPELRAITRIGEPEAFLNFTDPATIISREQRMLDYQRYIIKDSDIFNENVRLFVENNYPKLSPEQMKALEAFIGRNIVLQIATGLNNGNSSLVSHNEQAASFSPDGLRVLQFNPGGIQTFGATVSNNEDMLAHVKTKLSLFRKLGKAEPPFPFFLSKSQPQKTSYTADRNTRAELTSWIMHLLKDPEIHRAIQEGEIMLVPTILEEETGIIKSVPNLAI